MFDRRPIDPKDAHVRDDDRRDPPEAPRRIWEIETDAVFLAVGVLLESSTVARLLELEESPEAAREDAAVAALVERCRQPGSVAAAVERALDEATEATRGHVRGCPMFELAGWWLRSRQCATGPYLAALLWSLARDGRWVVRDLQVRVQGDVYLRALRLLGSAGAVAT